MDIVSSANEFNPGELKWQGDLYLKEFAFASRGKMFMSVNSGNKALADISSTWTKGLVLNPQEKTASKYEIADIDGSSYMFFEWKSGDYTIRGMEPKIYVLKKMDNNDYSSYSCEKKVDKIDYPFIDDPQVLGKWDAVDFVRTMDQFDPEKKNWIPDLYLTGLTFDRDGRMTFTTTKGSSPVSMTWTKGLVLCAREQAASAYTIKEINGSTYMFFEWKSGDYTMRGMNPYYYVLKKN